MRSAEGDENEFLEKAPQKKIDVTSVQRRKKKKRRGKKLKIRNKGKTFLSLL